MGLDQRLVCCDIKVKKVVLSINCKNQLTCVDLDVDGVSMVVGTFSGKVSIFIVLCILLTPSSCLGFGV